MTTSISSELLRIGSSMTPWKAACRVVATTPITLSGLQTVDGVALATGDRVLVVGQADKKTNGVYVAKTGAWIRSDDMAVSLFIQLGTSFLILEGTDNAKTVWTLTSPTTGSVDLGVTELEFEAVNSLMTAQASTPPQLSGLFFDFDPNDLELLTMVGTAIDVAGDARGGPLSISAPSSGQRPVRSTSAADVLNGYAGAKFTRASSHRLRATTGGPTGDAPHFVIAVVRWDSLANNGTYDEGTVGVGQGANFSGIAADGSNNLWFAGTAVQPLSTSYGSPENTGRNTINVDANVHILAVKYEPGTSEKTLYIDGERFKITSGHADQTLDGIFGIGDTLRVIPDCTVWRAFFCAAVPSEVQIREATAWLAERYGLWRPPVCVCIGDSLTYGQRPSPHASVGGYPTALTNGNTINAGVCSVVNCGISNYQANNLLTELLTSTLMRCNGARRAGPGLPGMCVVVWIGSNDLANWETAAAIYPEIQSICSQARALGFKVVVATIIWRYDYAGAELTEWAALNAAIRAGEGVDFDVCADLYANTQFQSLTASYQEGADSDSVHLCTGDATKGYGLVAQIIGAAVNEALGVA